MTAHSSQTLVFIGEGSFRYDRLEILDSVGNLPDQLSGPGVTRENDGALRFLYDEAGRGSNMIHRYWGEGEFIQAEGLSVMNLLEAECRRTMAGKSRKVRPQHIVEHVLAETRHHRRSAVYRDRTLDSPKNIVCKEGQPIIMIQMRVGNNDVADSQLLFQSESMGE